MIASLYHSGSSRAAAGAPATASTGTVRLRTSIGLLATSHQPQNVSLPGAGIEPYVVPAAPPPIPGLVEQIFDGVRLGVDRELDVAVLHVMRIEIDDHEHLVAAAALAVGDDFGVVGGVEAQRSVEVQRVMAPAD